MKQLSRRHQKTIKSMTRDARLKLLAFSWPGNVRQLRNVIESMIVVDCDESLDVDDLPLELEPNSEHVVGICTEGNEESNGVASLVGRPLHEIEKIFIGETLKLAAGNREQTAEMLGIGERTLYRKIKEYKLH
jgi:two-component system response regulator HydG